MAKTENWYISVPAELKYGTVRHVARSNSVNSVLVESIYPNPKSRLAFHIRVSGEATHLRSTKLALQSRGVIIEMSLRRLRPSEQEAAAFYLYVQKKTIDGQLSWYIRLVHLQATKFTYSTPAIGKHLTTAQREALDALIKKQAPRENRLDLVGQASDLDISNDDEVGWAR